MKKFNTENKSIIISIIFTLIIYIIVFCIPKINLLTKNTKPVRLINNNYIEIQISQTNIKSKKSEIENTENQNLQIGLEDTSNEKIEDKDDTFHVDLTKVSPMIQENVSEDVVIAAKKVI